MDVDVDGVFCFTLVTILFLDGIPIEVHPELYSVLLDLMRLHSGLSLLESLVTFYAVLFIRETKQRLSFLNLLFAWLILGQLGVRLYVMNSPRSLSLDLNSAQLTQLVWTVVGVFFGLYAVLWYRLSRQAQQEDLKQQQQLQELQQLQAKKTSKQKQT